MALQKATHKKVKVANRKPHTQQRSQNQFRITLSMRNKIFSLQNRLARSKAILDYAQSQKGQKAGALQLHLTERIDRLSKRIARKGKDLMRNLKRKHRTKPNFKAIYKKMAKRAYKLAKADSPKSMTIKDKEHVMNLKKQVVKLVQKHQKLVSQKAKQRQAVRKTKIEFKARKAVKKADKEQAKLKAKKTTSKKQSAKEKKKVATKKFKLHIAKLKKRAAKEHRHNLRIQDRKVMGEIKAVNKEILRVSGLHNERPSVLSGIPRVRIYEIQKRMSAKVERAKKNIAKEAKRLKKARTANDHKNVAKHAAKLSKSRIQLMKRSARLASFKKKKLKNPKIKAEAKLKKKALKKQNKYKQ